MKANYNLFYYFFICKKTLYYILRYNNLRPQHGSLFFLLIFKNMLFKNACVCVCVCVCVYSIKDYSLQHIFPPLFLFLSFILYYNILKFTRIFSDFIVNFYVSIYFIAFLPLNTAISPNSSSMFSKRLYFATRSVLHGAPVFICPAFVATATSANVVSSVSPLL